MPTSDITIVPERYRSLLLRLIETARTDLQAGNSLPSVYFIGSSAAAVLETVAVDTSSPGAKDNSAANAKRLATFLDADFVVMMAEVWGLPADKMKSYEAIMTKYGSLSAYPKRVDLAWFQLETRHGWFNASAPILAAPPSKKRRRLGPLAWLQADRVEGRLAGILPKLPASS